jgi:uncharacterized membrane protein YphA (DoxX/SURF4 family)
MKWFDRFWMSEAPALRLAMIRVLIGAYALVFLVARGPHLLSFADQHPSQFEPIGVVGLLPGPISSAQLTVLYAASLVLCLFFLLGFMHRIAAPLFAGSLLLLLTYAHSWGKINHTENLLALYTIVLCLTAGADTLSLDSRRRGSPAVARHGRYGWPIKLLCTLTIISYVLAGIAKLKAGGLDFVTGDTLRNHVAFDNVRKIELGSIHSPIGAALVSFPLFFTVLAWFSMLVELGAPIAMFGRRLGAIWAVAAWGFHVGILALMAIVFPFQLSGAAYLPFFRVERLYERLRKRSADKDLENRRRG